MRIAVLADTHLRKGKTLPSFVWDHLTSIDLIIHAGDLVHSELLDDLALLAPIRAVKGNCDGLDVILPNRDIVECEGIRIGIIHGDTGRGKSTPERAFNSFVDVPVDVIAFGHSHAPYQEYRNGVLLFNPGSPTEKRRQSNYSFGILDIQHGDVEASHIYF